MKKYANVDKNLESDQETFWEGKYGDDYISRNQDPELLSSNIALFNKIMKYTCNINLLLSPS